MRGLASVPTQRLATKKDLYLALFHSDGACTARGGRLSPSACSALNTVYWRTTGKPR